MPRWPMSRSCPSCCTARSARCSATRRTGKKTTASSLKAGAYVIGSTGGPPPGGRLSERWRMINRARSRTRACGEHAFRVVKQLWGFTKVRYRGLAKNLARAQTMFALANLYQLRHQLLSAGARFRCDTDRRE